MYRIIVNTRKIRKEEEEAAEKRSELPYTLRFSVWKFTGNANEPSASRVKQSEKRIL